MYCPNCKNPVPETSRFCTFCGFTVSQPPKKRKHTGPWVTVFILLIIISLLTWFFGSILFFKPRNLGVNYTDEDYESAIDKTGIEITFDGLSGEELEEFKDDLKGKKLDIDDYDWEFADYQQKSFKLTPKEATALLNEIAPAFWWFDHLQVNIDGDIMEGSSKADIARLKVDLYDDIADQIPIPLPDKVNIYSKGIVKITDNKLTARPEILTIGVAPLPKEFMTEDSVDIISQYLERIYTVVPGLEIKSLEADNGKFAFDGVIPQKVTVTAK